MIQMGTSINRSMAIAFAFVSVLTSTGKTNTLASPNLPATDLVAVSADALQSRTDNSPHKAPLSASDSYLFSAADLSEIQTISGFKDKSEAIVAELKKQISVYDFLTQLSELQPSGNLLVTDARGRWLRQFGVITQDCLSEQSMCIGREEVEKAGQKVSALTLQAQAYHNSYLRGLRAIDSDAARIELRNELKKNKKAKVVLKEMLEKRLKDLDESSEEAVARKRQLHLYYGLIVISTLMLVVLGVAMAAGYALVGTVASALAIAALAISPQPLSSASELSDNIVQKSTRIKADFAKELDQLESKILVDSRLSVLINEETLRRP